MEDSGLYGYIDATGEFVVPAKYSEALSFNKNGTAYVVR